MIANRPLGRANKDTESTGRGPSQSSITMEDAVESIAKRSYWSLLFPSLAAVTHNEGSTHVHVLQQQVWLVGVVCKRNAEGVAHQSTAIHYALFENLNFEQPAFRVSSSEYYVRSIGLTVHQILTCGRHSLHCHWKQLLGF